MELPADDIRRRAYIQENETSTQIVNSLPTDELEAKGGEFAEAFTTYLGAESPACRGGPPLHSRSRTAHPMSQACREVTE